MLEDEDYQPLHCSGEDVPVGTPMYDIIKVSWCNIQRMNGAIAPQPVGLSPREMFAISSEMKEALLGV